MRSLCENTSKCLDYYFILKVPSKKLDNCTIKLLLIFNQS